MLPQEIIVDILSRLPAKSIGRFRCVSKPWKSLLCQPQFINTHLNLRKSFPRTEESLLFVSEESASLYSIQLNNAHQLFDEISTSATKLNFDDHRFSPTWVFNMVSCDGLVLFRDEESKLLLLNPTTKEIKELPSVPSALNSQGFTIYGIGYDSMNDDYKVVAISAPYHTDSKPDMIETFVNLYSVKNGVWEREIVESSPYDHAAGSRFSSGVVIDGFLLWPVVRTSDTLSVIAAFSLEEAKFSQVQLPPSTCSWKFVKSHLMALGGCLCAYPSTLFHTGNVTDVWMMKQFCAEESWTKFTIVDPDRSEFRPLCLLGEEHAVLVKNAGCVGEKVVIYHMKEGTFKDVVVHDFPDDEISVGASFIESLVSPHCTKFK